MVAQIFENCLYVHAARLSHSRSTSFEYGNASSVQTQQPSTCLQLAMAATVWKGRLNFGLVSIPIKLFRAARAEKIHMHKLHRQTGERVRQVFVPSTDAPITAEAATIADAPVRDISSGADKPMTSRGAGAPAPPGESTDTGQTRAPAALSQADIVKGFEFEKGRFVNFEPGELEELAPKNSADMQIVEFVRFAEVDPVYLETSYYVAPDTGGAKPYSLLFETLKKTGYAAIGEFVMHRRDQIMILRTGEHGLIAHTLYYQDEVRRQDEYHADAGLAGEKEMALAVKLVEALAATYEPGRFKDQYRERLQQAIAAKVESQPAATQPTATPKGEVVDIMAALQESLSKVRKPVKSESGPAEAKRTKRAGGK